VPLPNSAGNRYTCRRRSNDVRDQFGLRFDYQLGATSRCSAATCAATPSAPRRAPCSRRSEVARHAAGLHGVAQLRHHVERDQPDARFDQPDHANPAVTSGLSPPTTASTWPTPTRSAGLRPRHRASRRRHLGLGDPQQPFVERVNNTSGSSPTTSPGSRAALDEVRLRHASRGHDDRLHQPPERRPHLQRYPQRQRGRRLPARPAGQVRATTQQAIQDGQGWAYALYAQDEFRVSSRLTLNLGLRWELTQPYVEKADTIVSFRTGVQSQVYPNAPTGLVYPGDPGVPRGVIRPTRTTSRRASRWRGTRSGNGRRACAPASASSSTGWPARATCSRAACSRRPSRRSSS
jgi:hypothetical protein